MGPRQGPPWSEAQSHLNVPHEFGHMIQTRAQRVCQMTTPDPSAENVGNACWTPRQQLGMHSAKGCSSSGDVLGVPVAGS